MIVKQAKDILDGFEKARQIFEKWDRKDKVNELEVLYRGTSNTDYKLLPGAYRRKNYDEYQPLLDLCQLGGRFGRIGSLREWETYYLAQHHGIPTRLLDWTESLGAAAFFAFDTYRKGETPCIWLLEAARLNELSINWDGLVSPENNPDTNIWLPTEIQEERFKRRKWEPGCYFDNRFPLAIYPRRDNERIRAQLGSFTVHGRERSPLEDYIYDWSTEPETMLAKIEFPETDRDEAFEDLARLGIQRTAIYPDIDNFVRQLEESHGWNQ